MMYEIGDKFTLKNTKDSVVYEIERIYSSFGIEPSYELKPIGKRGGRTFIKEETLKQLYNKL